MKSILFPAAALLAAALSTVTATAPGHAASAAPVTIAVSHADLNLAQEGDRRILEDRIARAARNVCRADYGYSPLTWHAERDCRSAVVARAEQQLPYPDDATD